MKGGGLKFAIVLLLVFCNIQALYSQTQTEPPQIINPDTEPYRYCHDSVLVAPSISIKNIEINESSEGMKVSILNYFEDQDILGYDKNSKFSYRWDAQYGYLEISGIGTAEEYEEAIRKVYYKNTGNIPILQTRTFTISLLDADYLPETEHFYRFIKKTDVTWVEAKEAADTMSYYGLKGYLATITSSIENDFIWTKIDGIGWIGASDAQTEGVWEWVTGPEKGTQFWQGGINGYPVNNEFSNWARGEPNNAGDEDFAHINQNPNRAQKSWNDLENEGDGPNSQYYRAQGYIVEFGGFEGEPEVKLSAYADIEVSKIAFSDNREIDICLGENLELNVEASDKYTYSWLPNENISNINASNPKVFPEKTTTYRAVGRLDYCIDTADFKVNVHPSPHPDWDTLNVICEGASIELNPGNHASYLWNNLETNPIRIVSQEGWYSVQLTNEFGCSSSDSTKVEWSTIPKLNYTQLDTLVCGSKQQILNLAFSEGEVSTYLSSLQAEKVLVENHASLTPRIQVDEFGNYAFQMKVQDKHACNFTDTIHIGFHNQPNAQFQIDEAECEGYNLKLNYNGNTFEDAIFNWYSNDTLFFSDLNISSMEIPLGYGAFNRSVGLKINEQGCTDSLRLDVTVTPILDFWPENNQGCSPLNVNFDYSASEEVDQFLWEFGDGISSNEKNPEHLYYNEGISDKKFDVGLKIISKEGCENYGVLKDTILIYPVPTVDFNLSKDLCYSDTLQIFYKGTGTEEDTYLWNLSDLKTSEIISDPGKTRGPLAINRRSAPTVELGLKVISEKGCTSEALVKTIKRKPIFQIDLDNEKGCPTLEVTFTAQTLDNLDKVTYSWILGENKILEGERISTELYEGGRDYDLKLIAFSELTSCADTLLLPEIISVYSMPKANFKANPNEVLISKPQIYFQNLSDGATNYQWNFGDNSAVSFIENPNHTFRDMGYYNVHLSASNNWGCSDTISQQITVAFDKVFPPNAFSPNAGIEEDKVFRIYSKGIANEGYRLLVFNRWGEQVFESNSQEKGWDGKMKNGNFAPAGVYTWVLQYQDFRGELYKQNGSVTLII